MNENFHLHFFFEKLCKKNTSQFSRYFRVVRLMCDVRDTSRSGAGTQQEVGGEKGGGVTSYDVTCRSTTRPLARAIDRNGNEFSNAGRVHGYIYGVV